MALALNELPFAVIAIDEQNYITDLNKRAEALTEYDADVLLGQPLSLVLTAASSRHISEEGEENNRFVITTKSANILTVFANISTTDNITYYYLYIPPALQQEALPPVEESTRTVLEKLDETYWEWDLTSDLVYHSSELMALVGYTKKSLLVASDFWKKHILGSNWRELALEVISIIRGKATYFNTSIQIQTLDQHFIWVSISARAVRDDLGRVVKIYGSARNITETKSLIKQLKKQNDYLSMAEKISNSGHWRYDVNSQKMFWSTELYHIFGTEPQSFTPSIDNELLFHTEENRERVKTNFFSCIKSAQSYYNKSTIILSNGQKTKIETIGEVEIGADGNVIALFGICRDITRSESILEKLKLLAMVNYTIKVPIFFIDEDDHVVHQELSPQKGENNRALFSYVNFSISSYLKLKNIAKKDGQLQRVNISFDDYSTVFNISVTYEAGEGVYIWIVENVTEKFRKEQQQIISNRLTLLGNTFGGVSHDINNVLGVALGAIEMLELKFSQGEQDITRYIDRVKNAIDKGKNVTERLLAFTKKPLVNVVNFDPIKEILDNQYLFQQVIIDTIRLKVELPSEHCTINFPQGEFINILLNLVLNSQDAIKGDGLSGKILIAVKYNIEGELEVHVSDSGTGIEADNLPKIFDPFYSSKSKTKGHGLGLANVYSTVYKHNGNIMVNGTSELGGAHFKLTFKCKRETKSNILEQQGHSGLSLKHKRILILDDEESIAEFVGLFLETNGAQTRHVTSKEQLLTTLSTNEPFDIFITDMILPEFTGREAIELVLSRQPNIKILSMSGYLEAGNENWPYPLLQKPFNSSELSKFLSDNKN